MNAPSADIARVAYLVDAVCSRSASDDELAELDAILLADKTSHDYYLDYCRLHVALGLEFQTRSAVEQAFEHIDFGCAEVAPADPAVAIAPSPPSLPASFPILGFPGNAWHATTSFFSQGLPLAYLVATLTFGLGLWIGSLITVTHHVQVAQKPSRPVPSSQEPEPKMEFVGRITGMIDCQWSDPNTATIDRTYVPLGRKYALASGLMEITYHTGAKVILQGPVTYEVESRNGGYISVGKLTARLEKKGEGGRGKADESPNLQVSKSSNQKSPFPLPPSPFVVRTPTVIVTDLGTEFGVEVDRSGASRTHVFRGRVELRSASGGDGGDRAIQLGENESARVEPGQGLVLTASSEAVQTDGFARNMPRRRPIKLFNTGVGLEEGQPDPHWQAVAVSNEPNFKPCPARAVAASEPWLANATAESQWITFPGDSWKCVNYTFRTTFDLTGLQPARAIVRGRFVADNYVRAIRINGHVVPVPPQPRTPPFNVFRDFSITSGFVDGVNTLEVEVGNNEPTSPPEAFSPLGLRIELNGSAWENTATVQQGGPNATSAER